MFGNHDYDAAVKLAADKSKELGKKCVVVPCGDEAPGRFTIGIPIKATSFEEFKQSILRNAKPKEE